PLLEEHLVRTRDRDLVTVQVDRHRLALGTHLPSLTACVLPPPPQGGQVAGAAVVRAGAATVSLRWMARSSVPKYDAMTSGSSRTSAGEPSAITAPASRQ